MEVNKVHFLELTLKYVAELGFKSPNGSFFECNWKVLEDFFEFRPCHVFFIELKIVSFSLPPMWKCISLLLLRLVYSPIRIKLKKKPNVFPKFNCPKMEQIDCTP
jgi:hypothetical protein